MQSYYDSPEHARVIEEMLKDAKAAGQPRPHDHLIKREFFYGQQCADLHARMDERKAQIEAQGGVVAERTRIGRNATCPCGSGRKFKKCCISGAELVGIRR